MKIVHIPSKSIRFYCQDKNASTSLYERFNEFRSEQIVIWDDSCQVPSADCSVLDEPYMNEISVVRNTFDRVASLFTMLRNDIEWNSYPETGVHEWFRHHAPPLVSAITGPTPFRSYVNYICETAESGDADSHWQFQTSHGIGTSKDIHVFSMDGLNAADVWLRVRGIGGELKWLNRSDGSRYANLFDVQTRSAIESVYAHEIDVFGFDFHNTSQYSDRVIE